MRTERGESLVVGYKMAAGGPLWTYHTSDQLFTCDCHPTEPITVAGTVTGDIHLWRSSSVGGEDHYLQPSDESTFSPHKTSCRTLKFSADGSVLYSGSKVGDIALLDVPSGQLRQTIEGAHSAPLYSMHRLGERLVATGDDAGWIKLWDPRKSFKSVMELRNGKDFVSDFASNQEQSTLLSTSGDGFLTAIDLRMKKVEQKSDQMESELLCVEVMKCGERVVVGDGEGVLGVFHWGLWGDITDRFPSHPDSIDAVAKVTEDRICTGCMDGSVRACQLFPGRVVSSVEVDKDGFPVSSLALTHDKECLVCCVRQSVHFWLVESMFQQRRKRDAAEREETGAGSEGEEEHERQSRKRKKRKLRIKSGPRSSRTEVSQFFADL